jgi:hypothetical protein
MRVYYSNDGTDDSSLMQITKKGMKTFPSKYSWIINSLEDLPMPRTIYLKIWRHAYNSLSEEFSGLGCHIFLARSKRLPDIRLSEKPIILRMPNSTSSRRIETAISTSLASLQKICNAYAECPD